jgi:hypothetical protein
VTCGTEDFSKVLIVVTSIELIFLLLELILPYILELHSFPFESRHPSFLPFSFLDLPSSLRLYLLTQLEV